MENTYLPNSSHNYPHLPKEIKPVRSNQNPTILTPKSNKGKRDNGYSNIGF